MYILVQRRSDDNTRSTESNEKKSGKANEEFISFLSAETFDENVTNSYWILN